MIGIIIITFGILSIIDVVLYCWVVDRVGRPLYNHLPFSGFYVYYKYILKGGGE